MQWTVLSISDFLKIRFWDKQGERSGWGLLAREKPKSGLTHFKPAFPLLVPSPQGGVGACVGGVVLCGEGGRSLEIENLICVIPKAYVGKLLTFRFVVMLIMVMMFLVIVRVMVMIVMVMCAKPSLKLFRLPLGNPFPPTHPQIHKQIHSHMNYFTITSNSKYIDSLRSQIIRNTPYHFANYIPSTNTIIHQSQSWHAFREAAKYYLADFFR